MTVAAEAAAFTLTIHPAGNPNAGSADGSVRNFVQGLRRDLHGLWPWAGDDHAWRTTRSSRGPVLARLDDLGLAALAEGLVAAPRAQGCS